MTEIAQARVDALSVFSGAPVTKAILIQAVCEIEVGPLAQGFILLIYRIALAAFFLIIIDSWFFIRCNASLRHTLFIIIGAPVTLLTLI